MARQTSGDPRVAVGSLTPRRGYRPVETVSSLQRPGLSPSETPVDDLSRPFIF